MRRLVLVSTVFASLLTNCAAIKGGLADASAPRIRGCNASQLDISNTYGADPIKGPKWKATCGAEVYECQGYMQIRESVRCTKLQ
jgi:hypothetical protein